MENKTEKTQIQSKGRLLLVDDNPEYVYHGINAARERGYEVDVAFDLKGAMSYLQSRSYAGVITDLQFFEEGFSDRISKIEYLPFLDRLGSLDNLEGIVEGERSWIRTVRKYSSRKREPKEDIFQIGTPEYEAFIEALRRSKIYADGNDVRIEPRADVNLREKIASELATPEYANQLLGLELGPKELRRLFLEYSLERLQEDIMESPPMGYEVIKYAQEHNMPIAVVTSVGHGQHCIPALLKTGLASVDSIVQHELIRSAQFDRINEERLSESRKIQSLELSGDLSSEEADARMKKCKEKYTPLLQNFSAIILDKAILVMWEGKGEHTYNFAIDMLEGKIDQTRPYKAR